MERSERIQLEAIQRDLKKQLARTETLLRTASPPKKRASTQAQLRARKISAEVKASAGSVTRAELKAIAKRHGFPFNNIGALYVAGYLKNNGLNLKAIAATVGFSEAAVDAAIKLGK